MKSTAGCLCLALVALAAPALAAPAPASAPGAAPELIPVAFFGGGALVPYYGGVMEVLAKQSLVTPDTPVVGQGSGALAAVGNVLGYSASDLYAQYAIMKKSFDELGKNLDPKTLVATLLPENITELLSGKVSIGLAQLAANQTNFTSSASWVVDRFNNKDDVVNGIVGSMCQPCSGGINSTFCTFRGQPVLDGAFANGWEQLCPDGNVENCIKVTAEATPAIDAGLAAGGNCTIEDYPSRLGINDVPYENGNNISATIINSVKRACPASPGPAADPFPLPRAVQAYEFAQPDIFPGKYGDLPTFNNTVITACDWQSWKDGLPAGQEFTIAGILYRQGMKDAQSYLQERRAMMA